LGVHVILKLLTKGGSEIVPAAGNFHHLIGTELLGIAKDILDNSAPFDTRDDGFDHKADT
jgi:hypothetical protein